jgi:hypothetical protein
VGERLLWGALAVFVAVWYWGVVEFLLSEFHDADQDEGARAAARFWPLTLLVCGLAYPMAYAAAWWCARSFRRRLAREGLREMSERNE